MIAIHSPSSLSRARPDFFPTILMVSSVSNLDLACEFAFPWTLLLGQDADNELIQWKQMDSALVRCSSSMDTQTCTISGSESRRPLGLFITGWRDGRSS
jgi:hypothetical protein